MITRNTLEQAGAPKEGIDEFSSIMLQAELDVLEYIVTEG